MQSEVEIGDGFKRRNRDMQKTNTVGNTIKNFIKEWSETNKDHDNGCIDVYINGECVESDLISNWYLGRLMRFKHRNAVINNIIYGKYEGLSAGQHLKIYATI